VDIPPLALTKENGWFNYIWGSIILILTILNMFVLLLATFAVLIFAVMFSFFLFIMYACVHIGWLEIKSKPLTEVWNKITKGN
jgi:hypothetical protein